MIKRMIPYLLSNRLSYILVYFYFFIGVRVTVLILKSLFQLKALFIKGSYKSKDFELGYSDVDFVAVTNSEEVKLRIKSCIKTLNRAFPHIKDIDIFTEEELVSVISLGGRKFNRADEWKVELDKLSTPVSKISRMTSPLKEEIEVYEELFFHLEWLFENLRSYKKRSNSYLERNITRILRKILNLYELELKSEENLLSSIQSTLEEVSALERTDFLVKCLDSYFETPENHYKEIRPGQYQIGGKVISTNGISNADYYFPMKLFKLFHRLGFFHLDSFVWALSRAPENIVTSTLWLRVKFLVLTGAECNLKLFHEKISLVENEFLRYQLEYIGKSTFSYSKNAFITAGWGDDPKRQTAMLKVLTHLKSQKADYEHLHIHLGELSSELSNSGLSILRLQMHEENKLLWHKEALFNIGVQFLSFSQNIICADTDVFCESAEWLSHSFELIENNPETFFQCFAHVKDSLDESYSYNSWVKNKLEGINSYEAPGLVWGISRSLYNQLGGFADLFIDGSNDGAFLEEITGMRMGRFSDFKWYSKLLRHYEEKVDLSYSPYELIHVNHGEGRDYINRGEILEMLDLDFSSAYFKNCLGVLEWSDLSTRNKFDLRNLYGKEEFSLMYRKLKTLNELRIPEFSKFYLFNNGEEYSVECFNSIANIRKDGAFLLVENPDKLEVSSVKVSLASNNLFNEEAVHVKLRVEGDFSDLYGEINANGHHHHGVDNRYFNEKEQLQFLDYSFSNWEGEIQYFPQVSFKIAPGATIKVSCVENERVYLAHAWEEVQEEHFDFSKEDYYITNSDLHGEGWYRLDMSFNLPASFELGIQVMNEQGFSLSNLRRYEVSQNTISYVFYKDKDTKKYYVHIAEKDKPSGKFSIKLRRRKQIDA